MRPFSSTSRPFGSCSLWRGPSGSRLAICSHSAGFSNPDAGAVGAPEDLLAPDPDLFLNGLLARHHRLWFEPGTQSSYSNLGPLVLAAAMATVTSRPFAGLVREEILGRWVWRPRPSAAPPEMRRCAATGYHRHAFWLNTGHIRCPRGAAVADAAAPRYRCRRGTAHPPGRCPVRPRPEVICGRAPELPPAVVRVNRQRRRQRA
jgi:CubicO group peptidase (beta-lactamase class C family)